MTGFVLSKDEKYLVTLSQKGELKLWRHENWTMVDLLASLSLGFTNSCMTLSESNRVILETATGFHVYDFD